MCCHEVAGSMLQTTQCARYDYSNMLQIESSSPAQGGIDELDSQQHTDIGPILQTDLNDNGHPDNQWHGIDG